MKRLEKIREREQAATKGPWQIWRGPEFAGGGEDICIGAGEKWLANMEHRSSPCKDFNAPEHDNDSCDICSTCADDITAEEVKNSEFIVHSREDIPWLLDKVQRLMEAAIGVRDFAGDPLIRDKAKYDAELDRLNAVLKELEESDGQ